MATRKQAVPFDIHAIRVTPNDLTPHIIGSKCTRCGKQFSPKREICPSCFDEGTVEEVALNPRGHLVSYTVVRRAPGRSVPYALGYVKTLDGVIVFTPLTGCEPGQIHIGMEMESVFDEREGVEGERLIVYAYKPVAGTVGKGKAK